MKFPITRESLQAFDYAKEQEELRMEEIKKGFTQILDQICKEFVQTMPINSKEKKFVWRNIESIRQFNIRMANGMPHAKRDEYLPEFIEKLKTTFIGCDIIIDPLKTYLIIDWS